MVAKSKKSKTKTPTIKTRTGMRGGSVSGADRECGAATRRGTTLGVTSRVQTALPPAKRR